MWFLNNHSMSCDLCPCGYQGVIRVLFGLLVIEALCQHYYAVDYCLYIYGMNLTLHNSLKLGVICI